MSNKYKKFWLHTDLPISMHAEGQGSLIASTKKLNQYKYEEKYIEVSTLDEAVALLKAAREVIHEYKHKTPKIDEFLKGVEG